ncbi:hypothetical protein FQR65_LT06789 [Abscondita terminalis]|nr:hypothetical protein FQR65_LT06789 [Abscondita terminalis]
MKLFLIVLAFLVASAAAAKPFKCQNGEHYVENNCNRCSCNNGILACSFKMCSDLQSRKMNQCTVGSTFKIGCNDCWCDKDYGTVCTDKKC